MKRSAVILAASLAASISVQAHLCNDVFLQAKDNLAVKVDIRDSQLRITDSAKFKVYLLNTMDRDIVDIRLEIQSDQFTSNVTPASSWKGFPCLKTSKKGGQKEFFEVELKRKAGVAQGNYKIGLHLFNGKDKSMVFKTVDINEALCSMQVPSAAAAPAIDGEAGKAEWEKSLLCGDLYEYKMKGKYMENVDSSSQTRFRFLHDKTSLFCLIDFVKPAGDDAATIFLCPDPSGQPKELKIDLTSKKATLDGKDISGAKVACSGAKMEIMLPLSVIGLDGKDKFLVNMTRKAGSEVSYWKGNPLSVKDPIVYANFSLN